MPTYVYEILTRSGEGTGRTFEHVQSMKDKALTRHPKTGEPVRRVPQAPAIGGPGSASSGKGILSNRNLERLGFTKYERKGKGYMERVAGKQGPRTLSSED